MWRSIVRHSGSRRRLRTGTWVRFDVGEHGILSRYVMQSTSLAFGDELLDSRHSFSNAPFAIKSHHILKPMYSVSASGRTPPSACSPQPMENR